MASDSTTTSTTATTTTTTSTTTTTIAGDTVDPTTGSAAAPTTGSLEFTLDTANGDVSVSGTATRCTNPSETTLEVTFSDGTQQVVVSALDGAGSVTIPGLFEGTIDQIAVGDLGNVSISGRGGLADDSAEATTFTVVGSCA